MAFGKLFIANPDLPRRFAIDAPLNEPNPDDVLRTRPGRLHRLSVPRPGRADSLTLPPDKLTAGARDHGISITRRIGIQRARLEPAARAHSAAAASCSRRGARATSRRPRGWSTSASTPG